MARDDDVEDKKFKEKEKVEEETEVQLVTNEQLINFKLDKILEILEKDK